MTPGGQVDVQSRLTESGGGPHLRQGHGVRNRPRIASQAEVANRVPAHGNGDRGQRRTDCRDEQNFKNGIAAIVREMHILAGRLWQRECRTKCGDKALLKNHLSAISTFGLTLQWYSKRNIGYDSVIIQAVIGFREKATSPTSVIAYSGGCGSFSTQNGFSPIRPTRQRRGARGRTEVTP